MQIMRRCLDEIDLAGEERVDGLLMIVHMAPLDTVELGNLPTGQP
jgi:hypothetical protein